jgi:hypothetical protein
MADLFTPAAFQQLRTDLARLTTATHAIYATAELAGNLHAAGQLADVLRHTLTDPTLAAALTVADTAAAPATALPSGTPAPPDDDLDWEALARGPQTDAERHEIFILLSHLNWPVKRIANMLHKYCGFAIEGVPPGEIIDDIATLDGRQSAALIGYLERHWAKQQEATR